MTRARVAYLIAENPAAHGVLEEPTKTVRKTAKRGLFPCFLMKETAFHTLRATFLPTAELPLHTTEKEQMQEKFFLHPLPKRI